MNPSFGHPTASCNAVLKRLRVAGRQYGNYDLASRLTMNLYTTIDRIAFPPSTLKMGFKRYCRVQGRPVRSFAE